MQSLFWLAAYFWHFARPSLALLLDPDLKEAVCIPPRRNSAYYDGDDEEDTPMYAILRPVVGSEAKPKRDEEASAVPAAASAAAEVTDSLLYVPA